MKKFLTIVSLGLLLASPHTFAEDESAPPIRYEVEILVFQNLAPDQEGGEVWTMDRVDTVIPGLEDASPPTDSTPESSPLTRARRLLEEDANYRVLTHKYWIQQARSESESRGHRIKDDNSELDGLVKFYVSRFLHVDISMLLLDSEQAENPPKRSDNDTALTHRISERRRVRSREIQYFDHPKFGILMVITPISSQ